MQILFCLYFALLLTFPYVFYTLMLFCILTFCHNPSNMFLVHCSSPFNLNLHNESNCQIYELREQIIS